MTVFRRVPVFASLFFCAVASAENSPTITLVANAEGENPVIAPNTWVDLPTIRRGLRARSSGLSLAKYTKKMGGTVGTSEGPISLFRRTPIDHDVDPRAWRLGALDEQKALTIAKGGGISASGGEKHMRHTDFRLGAEFHIHCH
jgi:hypothetical protein